ncbi:hypothetical protein LRP50_21585 [Enterovibrio sp. ZSDZ42]|uniref:Lipoprotein n=1 Tax=Enterovibrio gelatinilyticus TaxID=2899819 RepID=A0ABT5R883_9GAMM|nr:hypothetical protein [Enterovibrio sp. ZSDZ42]MDD1795717.1 hypothetical protein [Enterovibrio sp. ZSDZ42]
MKSIALTLSITSFLLISGCAIKSPEYVTVYQSRGVIQCESAGITAADSREQLSSKGVGVKTSQCGQLSGVSFISVCGAETSDVVIHSIEAKDIRLAEMMGYSLVDSTQETGDKQEFDIVPCE